MLIALIYIYTLVIVLFGAMVVADLILRWLVWKAYGKKVKSFLK